MPDNIPRELHELAGLMPESISDQELMLLLANTGHSEERNALFSEFHRRFSGRVLTWCFRFTRNRARAADLSQEVFLKAWRHLSAFRGDSRPSTWLYVIARNHCLTAVQRASCDPLAVCGPIPPRLPDPSPCHPDDYIYRQERCRAIRAAMDSALQPIEARIMTLHYGYEVPLAALTKRLDLMNPSGAKAYIVNGRRKLKNALSRRTSARREAA